MSTLLIGWAVAKSVFKGWFSSDEFAGELSDNLYDLIKDHIRDTRAQASAKRAFTKIAEDVEYSLQPYIEAEFSDVPKNEINAALFAVQRAINETPINANLLARIEYDADRLSSEISTSLDLTDISTKAKTLATAAVRDSSHLIIEFTSNLPSFSVTAFSEILRRESLILSRLEEVIAEFENIRLRAHAAADEFAAQRFEQLYRQSVARSLGKLELFGLDSGTRPTSRRYNLTSAYISLTVQKNEEEIASNFYDSDYSEGRPNLELLPTRVEQAAQRFPALLIKGEAGSGKTTLLQYMAVSSATGGFGEELEEFNCLVPFFVRLRELGRRGLPAPEDLPKIVAPAISGTMPSQWVHDQLVAGRALILVDGLDEVTEAVRKSTRTWLRELTGIYPNCRFIVTSRPAAVPNDWLRSEGFTEVELLPMAGSDVDALIDHWHRAVSEEEPLISMKEAVLSLSESLKEKIRLDRSLRELATTPLLCAMLCAMNRDRNQVLPNNRIALYSASVAMVLHGRDAERRVQVTDLVELDYESKIGLLQTIAFWMMKNNDSMSDRWRIEELVEREKRTFTRLQQSIPASDIVHTLIIRSGMIRAPVEGKIDFIHNAFKEYLAARAVAESDEFGFLLGQITKESWREVAALAPALTDMRRRDKFIQDLLDRGDRASGSRSTFHLMAIRCLESCTQLSPELQDKIRAAINSITPPRSFGDAKALSAAGDLALPLLEWRPSAYARTAAACVRTLRLIGTPAALDLLAGYAADKRVTVVQEVIAAWGSFDRVEYARRVLANSPGIYGRLHVDVDHELLGVRYLAKLRSLQLSVRTRVGFTPNYAELGFLGQLDRLQISTASEISVSDIPPMARLERMTLTGDSITLDLPFPARYPQLTYLSLNASKSITVLRLGERLRTLNLASKQLALDPETFARSSLQSVALLTDGDLPDLEGTTCNSVVKFAKRLRADNQSLRFLTSFPALKHLTLYGLGRSAELELLSYTCVEALELYGTTPEANLVGLRHLNSLKGLDVMGLRPSEGIRPLAGHPQLEELIIGWEPTEEDLSAIASLQGLRLLGVHPAAMAKTRSKIADSVRLVSSGNRLSGAFAV